MRLKLSTVLQVEAERVWAEVQAPRLLQHITYPLQVFEPLDPPVFPDKWEEGRYLIRLRSFGLLPIGIQWIVITKAA